MNMQSESIAALAAALAKAQGEMHGAAKAKVNPHFKSKYADLEAVWEACREPLSKNGLSVTQTYGYCEAGQVLYTQLMHASGEWIRSEYLIRPVQDTPQGRGSAETYAKRYNLAAIVGVAPKDEDDDGNAASEGTPRQHPPSTPPRPNGGNGPRRVTAPAQEDAPWKAKARQLKEQIEAASDVIVLANLMATANARTIELPPDENGELKKVSLLEYVRQHSQAGYNVLLSAAAKKQSALAAELPLPEDDGLPEQLQ